MTEDNPKIHAPLRSFGRIKARTLKPRQAGLFETLLPLIAVTDDSLADIVKADMLWLEIGFGGGEHLAGQAARNPGVTLIGCEPFINGVGSALRHVEEQGLSNVRILSDDARPLLDKLPDASLDRIFILFPDPWHKARHNKRRLIQPETISAFARLLKDGGRLRFATDWAGYADWTLERFLASPHFEWGAQSQADWNVPPVDHLTTRYETKGLGDCKPVFLDFVRRPR